MDEAVHLPEGAEVNVQVLELDRERSSKAPGPSDLLRMPVEERRRILMEQAEHVAPYYESEDRSDWQGGDIFE
jgi:hypothetical protein